MPPRPLDAIVRHKDAGHTDGIESASQKRHKGGHDIIMTQL